jgi:signal transduction histidine kinase
MHVREKITRLYTILLTTIGWIAYAYHLRLYEFPERTDEVFIFMSLVLFLAVIEYFRLPIGKVTTSIGFPVFFTIDLVYGLSTTIVFYGLVITVVNVLLRRPLRVVLYNPAQLIIAYLLAKQITTLFISTDQIILSFDQLLLSITILLLSFTILNNLFVDIILILRTERYTFKQWLHKFTISTGTVALSLFYCFLLVFLGKQNNRGTIDVLSYTFFFSPLLGLSLLSSIIVRLQREKERLNALVSITSDINDLFTKNNWMEKMKTKLFSFLHTDMAMLCTEQNGKWDVLIKEGFEKEVTFTDDIKDDIISINKAVMFNNKEHNGGPLAKLFPDYIHSLVYAPLKIETKVVGVLVVGRTRTFSFSNEDVQFLSAVANQLAVTLKTRKLIEEQEKNMILQERNRIARDIHDGIAQSIAGAVMNLEIAQKKHETNAKSSYELITKSISKLRSSLKEVRQSIYALRPYPTETIGLKQALERKIADFQNESSIEVNYEERGKTFEINTINQKLLFDIVKESLQNIKKHAEATHVHILLSYQSDFLLLKVKDNGKGFSLFDAMLKARNEPHFGILSMNEQAERCGATLQIDSKINNGAEIKCIVPRNMEEEGEINNDENHVS